MHTCLIMSILVLWTCVLFPFGRAHAQTEQEKILAAVQRFFDALEAGDAGMAEPLFLEEGQFYRVWNTADSIHTRRTTHTAMLESFPATAGSVTERFWDPQVLIHGRIAVVWTPYDFHRMGIFSHCGVDAFTLIHLEDGWKIAGAVYTVEETDCEPSPLGPIRGAR
jgi:hypothetical protein